MKAFRILRAALLCLVFLGLPANAATTLLPNGKQCFTTAAGAVVSGSLNMFVPNTTTPKATWQDADQTTLNSQPIQLDANGCAIIYGTGIYRQQLYDGPVVSGVTTGTLIWDQPTTDTSAFNSVFWAGISAGTPNVITITDPGFNGTDGTVINFTALASNTTAATINPSGYGAIPVLKGTTSGPVALTGGEIIQNNTISVIYSASANAFNLLNPPIQSASGSSAPQCGTSGLKIVNGSTPSSIIAITANGATLVSSGGLVTSRNNISVSANITIGTSTSTVNGMDGEAPGTSAWLYVWLVDNGSSTGALVSVATGGGLSPTLPSGYIYKCRVGAVRVDGSGNLLRTIQYGQDAQYLVTAATNTINLPVMASGIAGSATVPTWVAVSISSYVPPSATRIRGTCGFTSGVAAILCAPNSAYGSNGDLTNHPPIQTSLNGGIGMMFDFLIESTSVYWASATATGYIAAMGWKDSVNAN